MSVTDESVDVRTEIFLALESEEIQDALLQKLCERSDSFEERFKAARLGSLRLDIRQANDSIAMLERQKLRGVTTPEVERIVKDAIGDFRLKLNDYLQKKFKELEGATDAVKTG